MGDAAPSDAELVRAALGGDPSGLGLLLERHRADMRAVAVARLGYGPAADDAVQDAMLIAIRRLHDVRDLEAVGGWLRAIVRNSCRMQLRRATLPLVSDRDVVTGAAATAEEQLDRHALRDWVWHAIGQLSEPLQMVVLLRHFGERRSYAEIAEICNIPIGTVRSRLNQARQQLAERLMAEAEVAHDDAGTLTRRRSDRLQEMLHASVNGGLAETVADLTDPNMVMAGWWGSVGSGRADLTESGTAVAARSRATPSGRELLVRILSEDAEAGVRERMLEVTASRRFTLMECELVNPPGDPTHCPPAVLWLIGMRGERIDGVRLYHPQPA